MKALIYLLQVSACTAIFYLFYRVVLQKLTFFTINRCYLIATLITSFIIPTLTIPGDSIPVGPVLDQINYEAVISTGSEQVPIIEDPVQSINWGIIIGNFYIVSTGILVLQFLISLFVFFYKVRTKAVEKVGMVNLIRCDPTFKNGSFLNYIFLNDAELSKAEAEQILTHEYEHIKRYHSLDKILARIVQIILWFNPFSYLYSKAIEINHEFEVDHVVSESIDKSQYAELIFKLSTHANGQFYNHFSKFPLKTRLNMLFAKPSRTTRKIAYVFLLPLLLISCIAFANRENIDIQLYKDSIRKLRPTAIADISSLGVELPSSKVSLQSPVKQELTNAQLSATAEIFNSDNLSVINGLEKLGKNPLVEIDGKIYDSGYLYKIGRQCISGTTLYLPESAITKYGPLAKDGAVSIKTKNGEITYLTTTDVANIKAEAKIMDGQIYSIYQVKKENGTTVYGIKIRIPSGGNMSNEVNDLSKVGFMIDNRVCDKNEFVNAISKLGRDGINGFGTGPAAFYNLPQFEAIFWFNSKSTADTLKTGKKVDSPLSPDVKYTAADSIRMSKDQRFIYLYGKANLTYKGLRIQNADYMVIDKHTTKVAANSYKGKTVEFRMDSKLFKADSVHFNLTTMRAKSFGKGSTD